LRHQWLAVLVAAAPLILRNAQRLQDTPVEIGLGILIKAGRIEFALHHLSEDLHRDRAVLVTLARFGIERDFDRPLIAGRVADFTRLAFHHPENLAKGDLRFYRIVCPFRKRPGGFLVEIK